MIENERKLQLYQALKKLDIKKERSYCCSILEIFPERDSGSSSYNTGKCPRAGIQSKKGTEKIYGAARRVNIMTYRELFEII